MKKLVAYFSATGVTAGVASNLADAIGSDLLEICPAERYNKEDLNWWEAESRSTLEMKDPGCRPEITAPEQKISDYDVIFIGFPIWWNTAPRIVNTFLEAYDFAGKILVPFATSGGSSADGVLDSLKGSCPGAHLHPAKLLDPKLSFRELSDFAEASLS